MGKIINNKNAMSEITSEFALMHKTFFSRPVRGNIQQGFADVK